MSIIVVLVSRLSALCQLHMNCDRRVSGFLLLLVLEEEETDKELTKVAKSAINLAAAK